MLEPILQHHRNQFNRLHRRQIHLVIASMPIALLLVVIFGLVLDRWDWLGWLTYALLIALGVGVGVLEIKKTLVFRRDLHDRRGTLD